jgi:threonylcarbamoyladenosine tRNA methylthiotransferase MtaB
MADFFVENFGCRAARADGESIVGRLRALCEREPLGVDVVVVNTCSVTAEADRAARAFIRREHRRRPEARIVVTGCYAQRAPEELAAMAGVAAVVGNSHKALAPEIIFDLARREVGAADANTALVPVASLLSTGPAPVWADDGFAHSFIEDLDLGEAHAGQPSGAQTRPNLKIQEGCGNRCTFCVIPLTRGPSKSLPHAVVLRQVERFVASGGKELVLSGINLGRWGRDLSSYPTQAAKTEARRGWGTREDGAPGTPRSLAALVRMIFERTALPYLRLSSIEPMDWDTELIALMREFGGCRLARHAHLPLQSGSDAVLRRMHRRYRPWHYAEKAAALVEAAGPDLTLGADVMAGFPGETDREFEETLEFVRALPFGYLHLFPFSARPGTPGWVVHAATPVAPKAMAERMAALRALAAEKIRTHRSRFIGRELTAITLHTPPAQATHGRTAALTENFIPVELEGHFAANQLLTIRVAGLNARSELLARKDGNIR